MLSRCTISNKCFIAITAESMLERFFYPYTKTTIDNRITPPVQFKAEKVTLSLSIWPMKQYITADAHIFCRKMNEWLFYGVKFQNTFYFFFTRLNNSISVLWTTNKFALVFKCLNNLCLFWIKNLHYAALAVQFWLRLLNN